MKKYLTVSLVLVSGIAMAQEIEPPVLIPAHVEEHVQKDTTFTVVDQQAEFPGGKEQLYKYLADNLQYPATAIRNKRQGKCFVRFVVDQKGNISNVKIMKGVPGCPECDEEAMRVIRQMPKWTPGKVKGKAVSSYFNLPITFRLD